MKNSLSNILKDLNRDLINKTELYIKTINEIKESTNHLTGTYSNDDNWIEYISKMSEIAQIIKHEIKTIESSINLVKNQR